ncbi:MarR family winged helix-turn-helix transcriptional regulator [Streptomyces sp. NPDC087270]|uniref:MarR family winged helix-turn-helix transcriptional regulator n=1 Tax=Streptomyces sp. NPDC087270 TaxID=3365774 RepID=UPI0037F7CBB7
MAEEPNSHDTAAALLDGLGLLLRRMRQIRMGPGEPSGPERTALARLDRGGPATSAELARREQISPQSMGATLAALQARGLVEVTADPQDGRRKVLSVSEDGMQVLRDKRSARTELVAGVLDARFDRTELAQLATAAPLLLRLAEHVIPPDTDPPGDADTGSATPTGPDSGNGTDSGPDSATRSATGTGTATHGTDR